MKEVEFEYFLDPYDSKQYITARDVNTGVWKIIGCDPKNKSVDYPFGEGSLKGRQTLIVMGEPLETRFKQYNKCEIKVNVSQIEIKDEKVIKKKTETVFYERICELQGPDLNEDQQAYLVTHTMRDKDIVRLIDKSKLKDSLFEVAKLKGIQTITGDFRFDKFALLPQHENGADLAREFIRKKRAQPSTERVKQEQDALMQHKTNTGIKTQKEILNDYYAKIFDAQDQTLIAKYCYNLNLTAQLGKTEEIVGRDDEMQAMFQKFSKRKQNNPLIIGEAGVGKTALVEDLAQRIVNGDVPDKLKDKIVLQVDTGALIAGTKLRGEFEERLKLVLETLGEHENVILFFDEVHTLQGLGASSEDKNNDGFAMLKAAMTKGDVTVIGATTLEEYRLSVEKDGALNRRFGTVMVKQTDIKGTVKALQSEWAKNAEYHEFTKKPSKALFWYLAEKAAKLNIAGFEPARSIDLIDDAGAIAELSKSTTIAKQHINKALAQASNVPLEFIQQNDSAKFAKLENNLNQDVIGQEPAIKAIADSLIVKSVGLGDDRIPPSFLLTGPTGVGKTLTAKSLAKHLYGSEDALVRINMSDYGSKHTVSTLIGSPKGYKGSDEPPFLEQIIKNPHAVVVFDEIEKAHSDVFNIFLPILDDGYVDLHNGKRVPFNNTTILFTSNLGTKEMIEKLNSKKLSNIGFGNSSKKQSEKGLEKFSKEAIDRFLKPEFIGRLRGRVFNFNALDAETPDIADTQKSEQSELQKQFAKVSEQPISDKLVKIATKELDKISANFSSRTGAGFTKTDLIFSDDVKKFVAFKGYNAKAGARSMDGFIEQNITNHLSNWILENKKSISNLRKGSVLKVASIGQDMQIDIEEPALPQKKKKQKHELMIVS